MIDHSMYGGNTILRMVEDYRNVNAARRHMDVEAGK